MPGYLGSVNNIYMGQKKSETQIFFTISVRLEERKKIPKEEHIGLAQDLKLALMKIELSLGKYKKIFFLVISIFILGLTHKQFCCLGTVCVFITASYTGIIRA